jgi:hypothetical protein
MYMVAALAVLLISLTLWRVLPRFTPGTSVSYPRRPRRPHCRGENAH